MNTTKTIQSALISVFSKEGLEPIVKLHSQNVVYILQEETEDFIKNLGIPTAVEDVLIPPSWAEE
jgi:phosphoribosylaminoimidazolecarboxamide formyltransferase/IMP cyclohydrolase